MTRFCISTMLLLSVDMEFGYKSPMVGVASRVFDLTVTEVPNVVSEDVVTYTSM